MKNIVKTSTDADKKFIRICPKCKGTNLSSELYSTRSPESINFSGYICADCGYYGICPEMQVSDYKKLINMNKLANTEKMRKKQSK